MRYEFDDCVLDVDAYELRRGGELVRVEPQVFDVLAHLVRHRDRVVTKNELFDEVWGSRFVSESALTSRLKAARRAIGDDGQAQRCIRTLHGRGYRFVAPVRELVTTAGPAPTAGSTAVGAQGADDESAAIAADAAAPVRYTQADGLNIAYQVTGGGEIDIVLVAGFVSHLTLDWTERRHAHFLHRLGTFGRVIRFDKRGTGMSDRPGGVPDLEARMGDVVAVMDAARCERAVLFGYSEGGPMAVLFAATYPERVAGLVLYSTYARRLWAPGYPWGQRPEERARYAEQIEADWGWEADMRHMCPNADDELARWWGERCRAATSPGAARKLVEMNSLVDVSDVLGAVRAPTLVLHRRDDVDSKVDEGRYIAERIPGARFIELDGADHFVAVDPDQILDPVEEFVGGLVREEPSDVALTTLLVVHAHDRLDPVWVRGVLGGLLERYRGTPAISPVAPIVATFDGPGRAVRCAAELVALAARTGNLHLGAGLHIAEVARRGAHISGDGVDVARRVAERAPVGEVWATATVRDLLAGSGIAFDERDALDVAPEGRTLALAAASV